MTGLVRRLLSLVRRRRLDEELSSEISAHLDFAAADHVASGMPPDEARRAAVLKFGGALQVRESYRDRQGFPWLEAFWRDLGYAARSLRRSPGVAAGIVLTIALGIGLNTVVFSFIDAVLLQPLPFPQGDRLVAVWFMPPNQPAQKMGTNALAYFTIREGNQVFEDVGAGRLAAAFNVGEDSPGAGGRIRVPAQWFTFGMVSVLGVKPALGRWPASDAEADDGVVISDGLWRRLYGASPNVLGQKLRFDAFVSTIVGVMPPGYELLNPADFWLLQTDRELRRSQRGPNRIFSIVARLKPGVTVEQAQADMTRLADVLAGEMPDMNRGWSIRVETVRDAYVGDVRRPLLVFQGAVFFVLLIACANAAGLLLAHTSTRTGELSLRVALGANSSRIVRQLLTESALLAAFGGALGFAVSAAGLGMLRSIPWRGLPPATVVALDRTALSFTFVMTMATGVLFGVVPAWSASRPDLMAMLRESTRSATPGRARQSLRGAFVAVQVALSLVLLVGSGLMINSFLRLNRAPAGFDASHLLTFQVPFPRSFYTWDGNQSFKVTLGPRIDRVSDDIRDRLTRLPGVTSAALAVTPPLGGDPPRMTFAPDDREVPVSEREAWSAEWYPVSFSYFETLKIPLVRGRYLTSDDDDRGRPVTVVNAALANTFWPGQDPVGRRIRLSVADDRPREIIGVVGDVRQNRYQRTAVPQLYVPRKQLPRQMDMTLSQQIMLVNTFVARVDGDPASVMPSLRPLVSGVDAAQVVMNVRTVQEYGAIQLNHLRAYTVVLSAFGVTSIGLAAIGIYGILAHLVSQRRREIGVRLALGARPAAILRLVVGKGMLMMGLGVIAGVGGAVGLTRVLRSLLWGVTPTDPSTFAAVVLLFLLIGATACVVPAWRAARIDPVRVLRS